MDYYNEHDPFAAEWLGNLCRAGLIPNGTVDERDIQKVEPGDVEGYRQCHFFAGIGGWPYSLRLAQWPDDAPIWTASCPCQPISGAGRLQGEQDERHLWPVLYSLVRQCHPPTIIGEQVASGDGLEWLAGVRTDLEIAGYAFGATDLCAAGAGAPHLRQRLYWVAHSEAFEQSWRERSGHGVDEIQTPRPYEGAQVGRSGGGVDGLEHAAGDGRNARRTKSVRRGTTSRRGASGMGDTSGSRLAGREGIARDTEFQQQATERTGGNVGRVADSNLRGCEGTDLSVRQPRQEQTAAIERGLSAWDAVEIVHGLDGKLRRVGCGVKPLAYGIPRSLGRGEPELRGMADRAKVNRIRRISGYGNAIVPQVAAMFVRAFMESV